MEQQTTIGGNNQEVDLVEEVLAEMNTNNKEEHDSQSTIEQMQPINTNIQEEIQYTTPTDEINTDEYGNASGLIIVPAGKPPTENTTWTGDIDTVSYDTDGEELNFTTGELTFRFTSSSTNASIIRGNARTSGWKSNIATLKTTG